MNLILLDDFDKNSLSILEKLKKQTNKIESVSNYEKLDLSKFENVYLFVAIKNSFANFDVQNFIINNKLKLNIIVVCNKKNMAEPFVTWIKSLIHYTKVDYNISTITMYSTLEEDLKLIGEIISNKPVKKAKENVTIYTDGACSGNPGPGGWGAILICENHVKEISGYDDDTTNNRMELIAVIKALKMLKKKCNVELFSDSAYVVNAINDKWIDGWKNKNWKNSDKEQVKNIELWQELDNLISFHNVTFNKVKGHADDDLNNRCDELATQEIAKHRK